MDVQPTARVFLKRFGHETRNKTVFTSCGLDCAFHQHRMVASKHRVIDVAQVDLKLSGGVLRYCRLRRNILNVTVVVDVIEKPFYLVQVVRVVHLRPGLNALGSGNLWDCDNGLFSLPVQKVEFELRRHHRLQPHFFQWLQRTLQDVARSGEKRSAVVVQQGKERLRRRLPGPGNRGDAAGYDMARNIGVAVILAERDSGHGIAQRRQQGSAGTKWETVFAALVEVTRSNAFAFENATEIGRQEFHCLEIAVYSLCGAQLGDNRRLLGHIVSCCDVAGC